MYNVNLQVISFHKGCTKEDSVRIKNYLTPLKINWFSF